MGLVSFAFAGLIAVIPFLLPHHGGLATPFYRESVAFALGVAACFPLLSKSFWDHLEIPRTTFWLLAIVALIAIQTLFVGHAYTTQALVPGIYIVWATALVIVCAWIRKQLGLERALAILAWIVFIGGALHAVIGVVQYFDASGALAYIVDRRQSAVIYGNIGQRNHFATHIVLASFALIYLHATEQANRILGIIFTTLFALVLTASSSRAAAMYLVAGFLLSLASYLAAKTPIHRRLLQGTGVLLILFLLFQYLLPLLNELVKLLLSALGFEVSGLDALVTLQRSATDGLDLRISEWHKAWLMFLQSPLWGIGIGHYGWYSFNYQALPEFSVLTKIELFHHSHNLMMQVLAELGIAGLLLLALLVITWLRQAWPSWKEPSYWLIFGLLIVLFLHSNIEYPLWYSYFLGITAVLLGLGSTDILRVQFSPRLGQLTAGITLVFSSAMLAITYLGFQDAVYAHRLAFTTSPQQALATLHAVSKNQLLAPLAEASILTHDLSTNTIEQRLLLTTRVMQYRPNILNVNRQILYLALADKPKEASDLLKTMLIVYPTDASKYICEWKRIPGQGIKSLWQEAEKQNGGAINCGAGTASLASPS